MSEKIATTRISDLPENITLQMPNYSSQPTMNFEQQPSMQNPTYMQMNVHPNPYGIPSQNNVMPLPKHTQNGSMQQMNQYLPQNDNPQMMMQSSPQHRLPSRDMTMDHGDYLHDEQIQPNYIPHPKLTNDYINDYMDEDHDIVEHNQKKHKEKLMDTLLNELQTPIFIALLFFIFQLPIVNTLLFKKFSFLTIYNADGNVNFYGIILKSLIFGLFFYSTSKVIDYVSEL